ncbi:glutamine-hydrolyzing GMP synthase [Patescibacteria group bacterium]|nr:glutamine-hydrolyzing GMP synthase [Patescibacteria group bacterium]
MIIIIDFGSQTTHLISRRINDFGIKTKIINPEKTNSFFASKINRKSCKGIVLSGGPASVYVRNAPIINKKIFSLDIPILAICYGMQLAAYLLNGKVRPGKTKEYGPATLILNKKSNILNSLSQHSQVWMSHGDVVIKPPTGFSFVAQTKSIKAAAMTNEKKKIYCIQFHPEVEHTEYGNLVLKNFVAACGFGLSRSKIDVARIIRRIKNKIGSAKTIAAVSGGLDSTVAATLVGKAIGKNLIPIHIDSGLMRPGTTERVIDYFEKKLKIKPIIIKAQNHFLSKLKGVTSPEKKRKIIGKLYIDLFEKKLASIPNIKYLVQGTIYSDVIESRGSKHAANIKSHHNVGGLPKNMKLSLVEPIREFYTDQVREIAKKINIPTEIISDQPHPGPGYAIRVIGAMNRKRLDMISTADNIVIEEMKRSGWYHKVLHSFAILTNTKSTAVKGDDHNYGEVVAIRAIVSKDRMTGNWAHLPYNLLQKISGRIVNEITGVSRVVYDITTKPPATMEWE